MTKNEISASVAVGLLFIISVMLFSETIVLQKKLDRANKPYYIYVKTTPEGVIIQSFGDLKKPDSVKYDFSSINNIPKPKISRAIKYRPVKICTNKICKIEWKD